MNDQSSPNDNSDIPTSLLRKKVKQDVNILAPNYKPRYMIEETTCFDDEQKLQNSHRSICIILCSWLGSCFCNCIYSITNCISFKCCFSFCVGSKRRITFLLSLSALFCLTLNTYIFEPLALSIGNYHNTLLAKKQSFGFFEDIPEGRWKLLKKRVKEQRKKQRKRGKVIVLDPSQYAKASQFYQRHWQAEFTCPHEERVGTFIHGGKYVCDPRNIAKASRDRVQLNNGNGCLIYTSSASVHEFHFELALFEVIGGECEIHVFSPNIESAESHAPRGIIVHPWGFKSSHAQPSNDNSSALKTIQETIQILGHCSKTIDLLSLDCEGCEFDIYQDLFENRVLKVHNDEKIEKVEKEECAPPAWMQIIVQVHGSPKRITNEFFANFQDQGYVIFRKEPSVEGSGNEQNYGFLRLADSFFN